MHEFICDIYGVYARLDRIVMVTIVFLWSRLDTDYIFVLKNCSNIKLNLLKNQKLGESDKKKSSYDKYKLLINK